MKPKEAPGSAYSRSGSAYSRSLARRCRGWDVNPETSDHRAFAKTDKGPWGTERAWIPPFLPFIHEAGGGCAVRCHWEWRGPVMTGRGCSPSPKEQDWGWRLVLSAAGSQTSAVLADAACV